MKQALEVLEGREPAADSPQKFLTVRGLTEFLCVSRTQAWKMRRAGMPSYHIGNKLIFKPAEVEEWLRTQQGK
jgi:predicted DNA-binding transcriptional regulator AlpA